VSDRVKPCPRRSPPATAAADVRTGISGVKMNCGLSKIVAFTGKSMKGVIYWEADSGLSKVRKALYRAIAGIRQARRVAAMRATQTWLGNHLDL